MADIVLPGDLLGSTAEFTPGSGTYVRNGHVRASKLGAKVVEPAAPGDLPVITVQKPHSEEASALMPAVDQVVLGKVTRISHLAASVDILVVNGAPVDEPFNGVIRKEHVRESEIDKVKMDESFRPGDIVQAVVVSLGDARSYLLSTARADLGVIYAVSETGDLLVPINFEEMECPSTGAKEKRKCAQPQF